MENKEIVEGNKLIAEFISIKKDLILHCGKDVNYYLIVVVPPNGDDGNWHNEYFLNFHCSWDWLMPVVETVEKHGTIIDINLCLGKSCRITKGNFKTGIVYTEVIESNSTIEAVYLSVINFIKWYNNGK